MGRSKAFLACAVLCAALTSSVTTERPASAACSDVWKRIGAPGRGLRLEGVAVRSNDRLWAVGYRNDSDGVVLGWDGESWQRERIPGVGDQFLYLQGASVAGKGHPPIAVGEYSRLTASTYAIRRAAGAPRWRRMASIDPGPSLSAFDDVSVLSRRRAWAVGNYWNSSGEHTTLIERYTPSGWRVVGPRWAGMLHGVHARARDDVWVVGRQPRNGALRGLTVRYNGRRWRRLDTPLVGDTHNILYGVASAGRRRVYAVGETYADKPILLEFNGERWRSVPLTGRGVLRSVSVHRDEVVAVGYRESFGDPGGAAVYTYSGGDWSRSDMSHLDAQELTDVEHAPDGSAFAVATNGDVLRRPPLCS